MACFTEALMTKKFSGVHFKKWQVRVILWLTAMNVFHTNKGKPGGIITPKEEKKYVDVNIIFKGAILSVLVDRLFDMNMHYTYKKELWDALTMMYGVSDDGSELYIS